MLAASLAAAERTQAGDEDHDNGDVDGLLSPVSSVSGGTLAPKFDGAHLFAGHEGALVPAKKQQPRSAQRKELEELQARLDASRQREAELEDARAAAEAELDDVHRISADARAALESELEKEHAALEEERKRTTELEGRLAFLELDVEASSARGNDTAVRLEERVRALARELKDVAAEAERVRTEAEVEAGAWAAERARFEQEEKRWAQVSDRIESERARWEQEREELSAQAKDQVAAAADGLRALVQRFDVPLFSRESGLGVLVDALRRHLEKQTQSAEESALLLTAEVEKRAALSHELETAKGEIQALLARSSPVSPSLQCCVVSDNHSDILSHARRTVVQPRHIPPQSRNRGPHLRSPSLKTPQASWRSSNLSGRHCRLQKRAPHGSVAPHGPSAPAAAGHRPWGMSVLAHQAAPARTRSQSATWTCGCSRASTATTAMAMAMATARHPTLVPPDRRTHHWRRTARRPYSASRRSRCACRHSLRMIVR